MFSQQFDPSKPKKPKLPRGSRAAGSRNANFLPSLPTPEEKMLMIAKARKLNASAAQIEWKNRQNRGGGTLKSV